LPLWVVPATLHLISTLAELLLNVLLQHITLAATRCIPHRKRVTNYPPVSPISLSANIDKDKAMQQIGNQNPEKAIPFVILKGFFTQIRGL
jgi:hypothetical protein